MKQISDYEIVNGDLFSGPLEMLAYAEFFKVSCVQYKTKAWPIPLAAPAKSQKCSQLLAGIAGLNRAGWTDECLSVLSLVYC